VPDNRGGSFVIQCVVDDAPGCINDQPVTKQCTVHICECSADSDCPECYECDPQTYDCVAVPECTERVQVRLWVTTAAPNTSAGGNIVFESGYGPTTPFAIGENRYGSYDVHTSASVGTPKFTAADIPDVVEPRNLDPGTRVYVWAAFCGRGDVAPIKPLLGWEKAAWKVECLHLRLVTTGTLTVNPTWYEYQEDEARRWFVDSDMSGGDVVFASAFDTGWGWVAGTGGLVAADRMQTAACDDDGYGGDGHYYAGAMLLGTIGHVSGNGELFIGLGYKGIFSSNGTVEFFSGTEQDAIEADLYDKLQPPRVGQTPEVTW
jgi:hypothetical protein